MDDRVDRIIAWGFAVCFAGMGVGLGVSLVLRIVLGR